MLSCVLMGLSVVALCGHSVDALNVTASLVNAVGPAPSARYGGCVAVRTEAAILMLYGGTAIADWDSPASTSTAASDFWQYDVSAGQWTVLDTGRDLNTGVMGVPGAQVWPGAASTACTISAYDGRLYMLGGGGYYTNLLWRHDFGIGQWVWLRGSVSTPATGFTAGVGVADGRNEPSGRVGNTITAHPTQPYVYVTGGNGYGAQAPARFTLGLLDDAWQFSIVGSVWTCLATGSAVDQYAVYSSAPVAAPGSRMQHTAVLDTVFNALIIFGGFGFAESGSAGLLDDVWRFNLVSGEWSFASGSKVVDTASRRPATYYNAANSPGGRSGHTAALVTDHWTGRQVMAVFGGQTIIPQVGSMTLPQNDVWLYFDGSWRRVLRGDLLSSNIDGHHAFPVAMAGLVVLPVADSTMANLFVFGGRVFNGTIHPESNYPATSGLWSMQIAASSTADILVDDDVIVTVTATPTGLSLDGIPFTAPPISPTEALLIILAVALFLAGGGGVAAYYFVIIAGAKRLASSSATTADDSGAAAQQAKKAKKPSATIPQLSPRSVATLPPQRSLGSIESLSGAAKQKSHRSKPALNQAGGDDMAMTTFMDAGRTIMQTDAVEISVPAFLELVDKQDFVAHTAIGQGGFGTIMTGRLLSADAIDRAKTQECIVKLVKFQTADQDPGRADEIRGFEQEVSMMYYFRNSVNIARLYGFCLQPYAIVMKHYPHGTMQDLLFRPNKNPVLARVKYNVAMAVSLASDVANALEAMHNAGFAHNDIKPENILLDFDTIPPPPPSADSDHSEGSTGQDPLDRVDSKSVRAVLTDFGVSKIVTAKAMLVSAFQKSRMRGASVAYAPPELLRLLIEGSSDAGDMTVMQTTVTSTIDATSRSADDGNGGYANTRREERLLRADSYSFGILAHEMLNRQAAWGASNIDEIIDAVLSGQRPQWLPWVQQRRVKDETVAKYVAQVEQCWVEDALKRSKISAVAAVLGELRRSSAAKVV